MIFSRCCSLLLQLFMLLLSWTTSSSVAAAAAAAFLTLPGSSRMVPKPELEQFTNAQTGIILNFRLDVGKDNTQSSSHMNINGMQVQLLPDPAVDSNHKKKNSFGGGPSHLQMPGANGPQPQLSSGVRSLKLIQPGHFINMKGANYVETKNGCWEMVWRDGAAAGALVCGLEVTQDHRRNDAVLNKGRIFISFPIWTRQGLDDKQNYKRTYERMAKEHKTEYHHELELMQETNNWIMKAWHFRNAVAADEKLSLIPHREIAQIPSGDDELIALEENLFLSNKGFVWAKEKGGFGQNVLLGSALVSSVVDDDADAPGSNNNKRKKNKRDYVDLRP